MNINECPLEHHQARFPSPGKESVREYEYASRHAQLSVRGKHVFDRLLVLLPTHLKLKSQPTSRAVSPFPPALLFSICDALHWQPSPAADAPAEQNDTSVLPSVLSTLRDWRLLDSDYRYSLGGLYTLALDLAGITDEAGSDVDVKRTSHARLRMKWVSSDSPSENQNREPSSSTPPSPSRSRVLDLAQECAYALPDLNERCSDARYEPCQAGRLGTGTPDSEDASAVVPRRLYSMTGFRSGCSACRHARVSGPSAPPNPHMASLEQRTPFNQLHTNINTTVPSPRHPKPSVQHTTTKKPRREKHKPLQSISRSASVDENEPPLPTSTGGVHQGIGISFPPQRTHFRRISNVLSSRDPSSPAATAAASSFINVERRVEPSHLLNRTREDDKHTSSHHIASVDFRLPISNHVHDRASPIDLHPHAPTRTSSFSYTPGNSESYGHGHGLGSVAARVQKLSSNAVVGSRSSKRLPSWSRGHLGRPSTTTTTTISTGSLSPSPAKASFENPHSHSHSHSFTRLRPSSTLTPPRIIPSDDMTHHRDRRTVSSRTHKHTQSAGSLLPLSHLFYARKWQV